MLMISISIVSGVGIEETTTVTVQIECILYLHLKSVLSLSLFLTHLLLRSRFRSLFSLLPLLVLVSLRSYFSWREFNYYIISTH